MIKMFFKIWVLAMVFFSVAFAQENSSKNIIDIVDYRFNSIRNNINGDIDKIKIELEKIKQTQNETIKNEISNIDKSVKSLEKQLEKNISDNKAFEHEYHSGIEKYNEMVIKQDKKIEKLNSNINIWAVGILLVGLSTAIFSFLFIRIFTRKAKENAAKEVNEILDRWMKKKKLHEDEIEEEKNELKDQIEYWQNRYEELELDDKKLFEEFKSWSKNIEDKEIKNRIKKYIKKFQKEKQTNKDS